MREAHGQRKTEWRCQIAGAAPSQRLARSIRTKTSPKATNSTGAAALV